MRDALKSYLALASGFREVTRQKAAGAAKALVAQGEATAGQMTELADDLLQQSRQNREAVTALVKYEVDRAFGLVGLAATDEVAQLTERVRALEAALRERERAAAGRPASPARKAAAATPAKKATPTKATPQKATPQKATPRKATAKKAPAEKAPAKRST